MNGSSYSEEFPLLEGNGLYAADISGDGDCLFHALSDQFYGHENAHHEIRQKVVNHMRRHAPYFQLFMDVGGTRRAPKRKAAASAVRAAPAPTEQAIDKAFQAHLNRMGKSGVYGDNMEICAFAREYDVDVKIYQREFAYVITGDAGTGAVGSSAGRKKGLLHIAYHTWEHYSSIRNLEGPHTGMPNVNPTPSAQRPRLAASSYALPWMEAVVAQSLPYIAESTKIRGALEDCKGNVNLAVSRLLDEEEGEEPLVPAAEDEMEERGEGEPLEIFNVAAVVPTDGRTRDKKEKTSSSDNSSSSSMIKQNTDNRHRHRRRHPLKMPAAAAAAAGVVAVGGGKKQSTKQTRASARIKAKEEEKARSLTGSGADTSSAAEDSQKQTPIPSSSPSSAPTTTTISTTQRLKRETAQERKLKQKAKQKAAAKARKQEKIGGGGGVISRDGEVDKKPEQGSSNTAATNITTGIRELYV